VPISTAAGAGGPAPGLYAADWKSHNLLFAPSPPFAGLKGAVLTGTERRGYLYTVQATGASFRLSQVSTNLRAPDYNFESAAIIGG
jgi:hypothetical protein